jgi:fumarate hydratase, class II
VAPPAHPFEAQGARDALVELSGALKTVAVSCTKIANDIRWMGSGPRAGLAELVLPELQKGSSIMPGKVNPVMAEVLTQVSAQVIGNDAAITVGGLSGNFELNVYIPLMARNLLQSITYLAAACRTFAARCVDGITANAERAQALAESTLVLVTALNPVVGYDEGTAISKEAAATGRSLREVALDHGVAADVLDKVLDLRAVARGNGFADNGPADGDDGS